MKISIKGMLNCLTGRESKGKAANTTDAHTLCLRYNNYCGSPRQTIINSLHSSPPGPS